jgi:predicted phage-related endonuclease
MDPPLARANTEAWRKVRLTGFGASEAPAICGLTQWKQPMHVYLRKRQEKCPKLKAPKGTNEAAMWGHILEPGIKLAFSMRTGIEFTDREMGVWRSREHDFMLASPDSGLSVPAMLQCKATHPSQAKRTGLGKSGDTESLSLEWIVQAQQEMATMETTEHFFGVFVSIIDIRVFRMERNDELIAGIVAHEKELWERVQNGDPPEYDFNHPTTYDLVREECEFTLAHRTKALDDTTERSWKLARKLKADMDVLQRQYEGEMSKVMLDMGDAQVGRFLDGTGVRKVNVNKGDGYCFLREAAPLKNKR